MNDNIHCYINPDDIVTWLYPQDWGLYRCGQVTEIGGGKTVMSGFWTPENGFQETGEIPLASYLADLTADLAAEIPRETYAVLCQQAAADLAEAIGSKTPAELRLLKDYAKNGIGQAASEADQARRDYILQTECLAGIRLHNSDALYQILADDLLEMLEQAFAQANVKLSDSDSAALRGGLYPILRAVGPAVMKDSYRRTDGDPAGYMPADYNDPAYDPAADPARTVPVMPYDAYLAQYGAASPDSTGFDDAATPFAYTATLIHNLSDILAQHEPMTNLALVRERDSCYSDPADGLVTVPYLAADGTVQSVRAKCLRGTEPALASGWYVAEDSVQFIEPVTLSGTVQIILADGCDLTAADGVTGGDLQLYAQSPEGGTMQADAIRTDSFTQYGGRLLLTADAAPALQTAGDAAFCGGQLDAAGGISAGGRLTLRSTSPADTLRAGKYDAASVEIADGCAFRMPACPQDLGSAQFTAPARAFTRSPEKTDFLGTLTCALPLLTGVLDADTCILMQDQLLAPYAGDAADCTILLGESDFDLAETAYTVSADGASCYRCTLTGAGAYTGSLVIELPAAALPEQIASDSDLCAWAAHDYTAKTGRDASAAVTGRTDSSLTITLLDPDGEPADTYVIDAETCIGTNAAGAEVNLPLTGVQQRHTLCTVLSGLALLCLGAWAMRASGIRRKHKA